MTIATLEESEARFFKHVGSNSIGAQHNALAKIRYWSVADLIIHVRARIVSEPDANRTREVDVFVREVNSVSENRLFVERAVFGEPLDDTHTIFLFRIFDVA